MRILHLADLHFGKTLHNLSLIESGDQKYWMEQTLAFISERKPDAVVIAGDVYDRSVPSREAVNLLDRFLTEIAEMDIPVYMIAGNHDGGDRLQFASRLLADNRLYIEGTVKKEIAHYTLDPEDGYGPVTFWLMPYATTSDIRYVLGKTDEELSGYEECFRAWLEVQEIDRSRRNVLIAHQTVLANGTGPVESKSETAIGGVAGIDASVFAGFDYVALGHFHGAQKMGYDHIRYAGAPLCYHFGEAGQKKGPLMVTLGEKGTPSQYEMTEIPPKMRLLPTLRKTSREIIAEETEHPTRGCYVNILLTDEWISPDADSRIRALFESHGSTVLDISPDPDGTAGDEGQPGHADREDLSLEDYFLEFYARQTGGELPSESEAGIIGSLAAMIGDRSERNTDELAEAILRLAMEQEDEK